MSPHIPLCRCRKHYHFEPCPNPKPKRRVALKVIYTPPKPEPVILPPEDTGYTFYTKQKTKGDYYYCCTCKRDFYSEEPNPYRCLSCGSANWDNPNQWKEGRDRRADW